MIENYQFIFKYYYLPYSSRITTIIILVHSFVFSICRCPPIHFLSGDFRCHLSLIVIICWSVKLRESTKSKKYMLEIEFVFNSTYLMLDRRSSKWIFSTLVLSFSAFLLHGRNIRILFLWRCHTAKKVFFFFFFSLLCINTMLISLVFFSFSSFFFPNTWTKAQKRTNDDSNSSVSNARKEKKMMYICRNIGAQTQTRKNRMMSLSFFLCFYSNYRCNS